MKPAARRKARKLAVQAIYSWQLSQNSLSHRFVNGVLDKAVDTLRPTRL